MLVLGIDPGTRYLGWGLVAGEANRMRHVAHGVIHARDSLPLPERLVRLEQGLGEVLQLHRPDAGSVETLFFHKDAQAAAKLGHARGVVLLCLQRAAVQIFEYPPARVKSCVTGHGRAAKRQVAGMIRSMLCLEQEPPADAADALALAVTHLRRAPIDERLLQAAAARAQATAPRAQAAAPRSRGRRRRSA